MNYLDLKKRFPKSTNTFFHWVAEENLDKQNDYVDNIYFNQFFNKYFQYIIDYAHRAFLIDNDKPYFNKLKDDLVLHSGNENYNYYFQNKRIICNKYSDTDEDYIKINIMQESDFESAFFVLERLIENKFYVGK